MRGVGLVIMAVAVFLALVCTYAAAFGRMPFRRTTPYPRGSRARGTMAIAALGAWAIAACWLWLATRS